MDEKERSWTSYSAITTHRACPQRWNYRYERGLEKVDPEDVKVELEFGNWWHALRAADSIERGAEKGSLKWIPSKIKTVDGQPPIPLPELKDVFAMSEGGYLEVRKLVLEHADHWWENLASAAKDAWVERLGESLPVRLRYSDARWQERWEDDLRHESPLAVEFFWKRPLPTLSDPDTGEVKDTESDLLGYVDEIYLDERRGIVVVRDHKSSKALKAASSAEDMMNSQLQVYAWGGSPEVTSWGHGPIRAVAYDRVRSVHPSAPTLTASGRLAQRGGQPSVSGTDLVTYLSWSAGPDGGGVLWGKEDEYYVSGAKKGQPKFGMYQVEDSVIQTLSDPASLSIWHQRTLTPLNSNIVRTHLRSAVDTAFDINRTKFRVEESREAGRNLGDACRFCDFAELCRAEMTGGPDGDYDLQMMRLRQKPAKR